MKKLLMVFMFAVLVAPSATFAGLKAPDVLDSEKIITGERLSKYKVVGVRPFSVDDVEYENVDDEEMRKMKREVKDYQKQLAETLKDNLEDAGFEAFILEGDAAGKAEMVIEGKFTMVNLGSTAARVIFGFGAGQTGVGTSGSLVDAKSGEALAKFEHESTSGLDERFDKWQMVGNEVREMADDIAEFVEKLK